MNFASRSSCVVIVLLTRILIFLDVFHQFTYNNNNNYFYCNAQSPPPSATTITCDFENDNCPWQFDGECDNEFGLQLTQCYGGDCYDCDRCQVYHYDCNNCIMNGCQFCPGDGTCYESSSYPFLATKPCSIESNFNFQTTCNVEGTIFSDPLYTAQEWIYNMINVIPVWQQGILGTGVRVRVNDDGFDVDHPEFDNRFNIFASCDRYLPADPIVDDHGTSVMSVVGAGANNDECAVGIAPNVSLSGCYGLIGDEYLDEKLSMFDISVNSYGYDACLPISFYGLNRKRRRKLQQQQQQSSCPFTFFNYPLENLQSPCNTCTFPVDIDNVSDPCRTSIIIHCKLYYEADQAACLEFLELLIEGGECRYNQLSLAQRERITNGIINGRDGKGIIFLFAAGNEFATGEDINFEGFLNTRFTITVGAVGSDGLHASYSTPGAALFMTAPGGDRGIWHHHLTASVGGGCTDGGSGTSLSTPVAAGVIALMLEVNPDLGWRDVQAILALTSKINVQDNDDVTRITNAAGYTHSNLYGFGLVDAEAAVNEAKTWNLLGPENMIMQESNELNIFLPDDRDTTQSFSMSITTSIIDDMEDFIVESVVVYLDINHASRGDLDIILTSPQGTESILHPGNRPETRQDEQWKLLTVRNWGESAIGEWNLSITDISEGNTGNNECVNYAFAVIAFGLDVTCDNLELNGVCNNGQFDESFFGTNRDAQVTFTSTTNDDGQTMFDACCACGGGQPTNDVVNQLVSWQLVIYGQSILLTTPSPTDINPTITPSELPSLNPTSNPTRTPTSSPTTNPTRTPTSSPTSNPTRSPTASPNPTRSSIPTSMPTSTTAPSTTTIPSLIPTKRPTPTTTNSPTMFIPSKIPTSTGSPFPTQRGSPTSTENPTISTKNPTSVPTTSKHPTSSPTFPITSSPTSSPILPTTSTPSQHPSVGPTSSPTAVDNNNAIISGGQRSLHVLSSLVLSMFVILISTATLLIIYF